MRTTAPLRHRGRIGHTKTDGLLGRAYRDERMAYCMFEPSV